MNHPTLILWGEADDVLGTGDATKFEQAIPGSQLIWIREAGHVPHFDQLTSCTWRLKPQLHKRNLPTQVIKTLDFRLVRAGGLSLYSPRILF